MNKLNDIDLELKLIWIKYSSNYDKFIPIVQCKFCEIWFFEKLILSDIILNLMRTNCLSVLLYNYNIIM